MKELKKNLKRGFTLVELIVVMVIIAILGGVGFNAFSNYIAEANLTKYEDQFSAKQNAVAPKFSKSFTEPGMSYSVSKEHSGYHFENVSASLGAFSTVTALTLPTFDDITLNGEQIKLVDVSSTDIVTSFPDNVFRDSSVNEALVVSEPAPGKVAGTYYKKITDANICNSDAFAQKSNTATRRYVGAGAANCFIANTHHAIKIME